MCKCGAIAGVLAALLLGPGTTHAEEAGKEPSAIVEIGAAGETSLRDGGFSSGPSVAVEVTPHWR